MADTTQFRLLVDIDVLEILSTFSTTKRRRFYSHLRKIQKFPKNYSELTTTDEVRRQLDLSTFDGVSIRYWTDFADKHVKILELEENE